jgi:anaerobic ribonucleoside-triphosphate reductase
MNATQKKINVCITRCNHCGYEACGFSRATGDCPQCGRSGGQRFERWINNPHPDTLAKARREHDSEQH